MAYEPTWDRSAEAEARALAQLLRDGARAERDAQRSDGERERLLRAVHVIAEPRRRQRRAWPWLLAAAAVALLVALHGWWPRGPTLTCRVDGAAQADCTMVSADTGSPVKVRFSDGSTFEVEPGSHLAVESMSSTGSRLTLTGGQTVAHVVQSPGSSWALAAGPFEVRVTGTSFRTGWDPSRQQLSVELYEGSVQVLGTPLGAPVAVHAGQRLEAAASQGQWRIVPTSAPLPVASSSAAAAPDASAPEATASVPSSGVVAPSWQAGASELDWAELMARADFDTIVRQASERGIDRCLSTCPLGELRMLADAARYSRRFDLAERTLRALRRRAPGEAATAAFLLARLNESRGHSADALRWYEQHLQEAPGSSYAAEALAGRMRLLLRTQGPEAARPVAEAYLARFPGGVHVAAARQILQAARNP